MRAEAPVLESVRLQVKPGRAAAFEQAFREAAPLIAATPGYLGHTLQRCVEDDHRYLLQVYWRALSDHTVGFRESTRYAEWRRLLHHFYDPFPTVEHFVPVLRFDPPSPAATAA